MFELIGFLWQNGLERPMINLLIILANLFGGSFGLAIIALTFMIRGATTPLTLRQPPDPGFRRDQHTPQDPSIFSPRRVTENASDRTKAGLKTVTSSDHLSAPLHTGTFRG